MKPSRSVDEIRNSGIYMEIGDDAEGPIREMIGCDALYIIKDFAIYKIRLADDIDPDRTNAIIPNVQQKYLNIGYQSEIVGRILLTSKSLLSEIYFDKIINHEALTVAFFLLENLVSMQDLLTRLIVDEDEAETSVRVGPHRSLSIPSVSDLAGRTKSFVQRADHVTQELFRLCRLFYDVKKGWFRGLIDVVREKHPGMPEFAEFLEAAQEFILFVRNTRNCVEHPKDTDRLFIRDFRVTPRGELYGPAVEIAHPETPEPEAPLRVFMDAWIRQLIDITETLIAYMAKANATFGGFDIDICELPEGQRRHPHVKYSYAVKIDGEWRPLG